MIASTGNWQIFLPVKNESSLERIKPDYTEIDRISRENDVIGIYVYYWRGASKEDDSESNAICRNFVPTVGIKEDPATGTAAGALACVLHKSGSISGDSSITID